MEYQLYTASLHGSCRIENETLYFRTAAAAENAFFTLTLEPGAWEEDCYIFSPACAYNGNRIRRVVRSYPPIYTAEDVGEAFEPLMTDVPALEPDGSGQIQVTAGDMATPCAGIFFRHAKKALLLFFEQEVKGRNIGCTLEKGRITLSYPSDRSDSYRFCTQHDTAPEAGIPMAAGEEISSRFRIFTFDCDGIPAFFREYFRLRKCLMSSPRAAFGYTEELWQLMERHFNEWNWSGEYYAEMSKVWQCGWVGGGMSTVPLLERGSELSRLRAEATLDFMTAHQTDAGFFHSVVREGRVCSDGFEKAGLPNLHLIRKSADGLYFLFKNFAVFPPKPAWEQSARRCADAFVRLLEQYGHFGQFIDNETGRILVPGSASGAMAIGGLVKAAEYFGEERYLTAAIAAMERYYGDFCASGVTNGGPGEIHSAPDSESAFALLESAVVLYEATRDARWLEAAETLAALCSSWVVTYAYKFPAGSEFGRLGINTVGAIFANIQNKHAAPGICTLSGDSLLRLYRITKNDAYLELLKDIAHCLPQCVSTEEKPVYSWDVPPKKLPAGFICERVNMSDWEGPAAVGGVFWGSCWSETSLLLSFTELMTQKEMLPER